MRRLLGFLSSPGGTSWRAMRHVEKVSYLAALSALVTSVAAATGFFSGIFSEIYEEPDYNFVSISPRLGIQFLQDGAPVRIRRDSNEVLLSPSAFVLSKRRPVGSDGDSGFLIGAHTHTRLSGLVTSAIREIDGIGRVVALALGTAGADSQFSTSRLRIHDEMDTFDANGTEILVAFWTIFVGDRLNASDDRNMGVWISSIVDETGAERLSSGSAVYITVVDRSQIAGSPRFARAYPPSAFEHFRLVFE